MAFRLIRGAKRSRQVSSKTNFVQLVISTVIENGQDAANPVTSSDLSPSDQDRPEPVSLEVEFALVIARMIDSLKNNPEDVRQAIYQLARYKLQEQLPNVNAEEEKERTQRH